MYKEFKETTMTQREKIDLLENFSTYLAANGYMDDDWRSEPPYAIDEFLKLTTPLLDKEEPQQYKTVSVGEIFSVGGKHYVFRNPETASEKPTTDHGHILHEVNFVTN